MVGKAALFFLKTGEKEKKEIPLREFSVEISKINPFSSRHIIIMGQQTQHLRPNEINGLFQNQSLTLEAKAMRALTALIQKKEFDSREKEEDYVEEILKALDGKCLQTSVVSEEIAREAVGEMERKKEIENVINRDAPMAVDEEDGEVEEKEDDDDDDVEDE